MSRQLPPMSRQWRSTSRKAATMSRMVPVVSRNLILARGTRRPGDGRVVTNSRDVAAFFGKRHDNVLRDVDALVAQHPQCLLNFKDTSATVAMPRGGTRVDRCFDMTRDGFMILAMWFTGAKAPALERATDVQEGILAEMQRKSHDDDISSLHRRIDDLLRRAGGS